MILVLVCIHAGDFFYFFFFFFFFAFKLMFSAHGEMQWQKLAERKKSPEIAKLTTQSIVFFKGRINEIFVNY